MSALREHQLRLLDLLVEFDSVCTRLGITWWIDSGTLLGAVRHGGFIPWDDDLDVCVLASDYRKIRKLLSAHLSSPYALDCSKRGQTRLSPRFIDTGQSVLRHDPLTGAPREEKLWIDTFMLRPGCLRLKRAIDPLYGRCVRRINGSIRDGALKRIAAYMLFPAMWVAKGLAIIIGKLFHRKNLLHDFGVPFYSVRRVEDIFPLGTISFEGKQFPAPADPDSYLRRIYGDYTKEPEDKSAHEIIF